MSKFTSLNSLLRVTRWAALAASSSQSAPTRSSFKARDLFRTFKLYTGEFFQKVFQLLSELQRPLWPLNFEHWRPLRQWAGAVVQPRTGAAILNLSSVSCCVLLIYLQPVCTKTLALQVSVLLHVCRIKMLISPSFLLTDTTFESNCVVGGLSQTSRSITTLPSPPKYSTFCSLMIWREIILFPQTWPLKSSHLE